MIIVCPKCLQSIEFANCQPNQSVSCPHCSAQFIPEGKKDDNPDDFVPQKIGRFPIKRLIGHGGMCRVYEGTHPELNIPVAIKIPRAEYLKDSDFCSRFSKSARICAKISHPNIVKVYEYGEDTTSNTPYLVMEYIGGGTLCDLLAIHGCFSADETVRIAHAICQGLLVAEKQGIVHRDIKPDNIMISNDGQYKLADLGLAKQEPIPDDPNSAQILREGFQTRTGDMYSLGTLDFMPPEQLLNAATCDSRADIYSLGVTMYQLSTGRLPIECGEKEDFRQLLLTREPFIPSKFNEKLPILFDYIVMNCIQKTRRFRYQSFGELDKDLKAFLHGDTDLPSMHEDPPVLETRQNNSQNKGNVSRPLIVMVILLFIAILIIAGMLTAKMLKRDTSTSAPGIQRIQKEQKNDPEEAMQDTGDNKTQENEEEKMLRQIERSKASATVSVVSMDQDVTDARQEELFMECKRNAEKAMIEKDGFQKVINELKGFISSGSPFENEAARLNVKLEEQSKEAVRQLMDHLDATAAPLLEAKQWTNAQKVYRNASILQEESQEAREQKIKEIENLKEKDFQSNIVPIETK